MSAYGDVVDAIEALPVTVGFYRQALGLTFGDVCQQAGVSRNTLFRHHQGSSVNSDTLLRLLRWVDDQAPHVLLKLQETQRATTPNSVKKP